MSREQAENTHLQSLSELRNLPREKQALPLQEL